MLSGILTVLAAVVSIGPFLGEGPVEDEDGPGRVQFRRQADGRSARSPLIESITVLQQSGARPRFDPSGARVAFDRKDGKSGLHHVYICDVDSQIVKQVTGSPSDPFRRSSGNPVFSPTGSFLVFIAEENEHALDSIPSTGDPGVGLFCNLWACNLKTGGFTRLTEVAYPRDVRRRGAVYRAIVNPHFSRDGRRLLWTERYGNDGKHKWGDWRIMEADVESDRDAIRLLNVRVGYTPSKGNYVTYMGQFDSGEWLVSGNLDGQDPYGMDVYAINPRTGRSRNLANSPESWEEDANVTPGQRVIFMSNKDSAYKYDPNMDWKKQKITREYYITDPGGSRPERLTYLNDPTAPEYLGKPAIAVASDVSPDGRLLVGTLGLDHGGGSHRTFQLSLMLIRFKYAQ